MHDGSKQKRLSPMQPLLIAVLLGLGCAWLNCPIINQLSEVLSELFIRLLKLVSLPIIFFSLLATLSGMSSMRHMRIFGGVVLKYTLLTTLSAAGLALLLYILINPANGPSILITKSDDIPEKINYWQHILNTVPSNIIEPFYQNNSTAVLLLALLLSTAVISLKTPHKATLQQLFESLFAAIMQMTRLIMKLIPLAVWGFITQFAQELKSQSVLQGLPLYLLCILLANIIQAMAVLPILLKMNGLSPWKAVKAMWPALTIAFFSKSSSAALASAVDCAENRLGVDKQIARFSMPLCITVNMNACAAFILITVLFVSQSHGVHYSALELVGWIFIATVAAIGNASVPMGCYMLSSAFLSTMGVPLPLLAIILPFYALIDMLESAINVWSDACVTAVAAQHLHKTTNSQPENNTHRVF
ncbi:MAG: cation:dicarboxylase symporter family transporter [Endozoicomonas sp. (ex Botrylloides leachii)]|nr:cation:dicarboxylase symporter family transporter [Endozoicomonas sp. (ex Botrylloides leachii)]